MPGIESYSFDPEVTTSVENVDITPVLSLYEGIRRHEHDLQEMPIREAVVFLVASYRHERDLETDALETERLAARDIKDRTLHLLAWRLRREEGLDGEYYLSQFLHTVDDIDRNNA